MKLALFAVLFFVLSGFTKTVLASPPGGALDGNRPRVIVSSDRVV